MSSASGDFDPVCLVCNIPTPTAAVGVGMLQQDGGFSEKKEVGLVQQRWDHYDC